MIKFIKGIWQLQIIKSEISRGNTKLAEHLILTRKKQGYRLSLLEKVFLENQRNQKKLKESKDKLSSNASDLLVLKFPVQKQLTAQINTSFRLVSHDDHKIECTGIEKLIFAKLETELVNFLQKIITTNDLSDDQIKKRIDEAHRDLMGLKKGLDPTYDKNFSPHVYLIKYFLDNVYCSYLAYFFIYQVGELPKKIKILDIAAGPATMLFGLSLFLESLAQHQEISDFNCSYYSLEKERNLQYRGLQFWRQYINELKFPPNIFYQFNTVNIFDYDNYSHKLPKEFFNLIIIAHCFFYQGEDRSKSLDIYRSIFKQCLEPDGKVLLVIQGNKFYKIFDTYPDENLAKERDLIKSFLDCLGLRLILYKYFTSTGKRTNNKEDFKQFIQGDLPERPQISKLQEKYFGYSSMDKYIVDDFVIYAEKQV
ncbi:Slr0286 family photosystem II assembly protein [Synechocystis sp. CACIAM 05]|uniref:Slr0286 family photosystem II assembly protein n=1 Tax=Synechocystis sp. CACIAM 05 TaxID=1933929 RepID=UPI00138E870B|nr:hypothetical protein [Synechocystis sp. CACIAM 05]QHV00384.1 hypothetical protein BWK47_09775 [Synechocystis sp. CACIAM 05]